MLMDFFDVICQIWIPLMLWKCLLICFTNTIYIYNLSTTILDAEDGVAMKQIPALMEYFAHGPLI